MVAQNWKKKKLKKLFAFLNAYYPKTHLIKALNSLDSSRPNGRLSQNPKTGGFRELFLPENDFQTSSTKNSPKKHVYFGGLETNRRHEIQTWFLFHISFYIWTQYNIRIVLAT